MSDSENRVERLIVESVSALLDGIALQDAPVRMLPAALGRLFEELLADEKGWSRFWWIDEASPETIQRSTT